MANNNNIRVAELLEEASNLLRMPSSQAQQQTSQVVSRAAAMLRESSSSGFTRLNRTERLRAAGAMFTYYIYFYAAMAALMQNYAV